MLSDKHITFKNPLYVIRQTHYIHLAASLINPLILLYEHMADLQENVIGDYVM